MTRTRSLLLGVIVTGMILVGCGGGGDDEGSSDSGTGTDVEAVESDAANDSPSGSDSGSDSGLPEQFPPVIAGLDPVIVTSQPSGGGERPLLEWEAVPDASRYLVVLYGADGEAIWSTVTSATETYVGGPSPIPDANSGPRVETGSSWVVYADDADGGTLAVSGRTPIDP